MAKRFSIHHLSDIHIGKDEFVPGLPPEFPKRRGGRREAYLYYLKHCPNPPECVIISGDIVSTGAADEYAEAESFLRKTVDAINKRHRGKTAYRVCLVPGNHDLDWSAGEEFEKKIAPFKALSERLSGKVFTPWSSDSPVLRLHVFHHHTSRSDRLVAGN